MHIILHLTFATIFCFAVSDARQQQHDIGKKIFYMIKIKGTHF